MLMCHCRVTSFCTWLFIYLCVCVCVCVCVCETDMCGARRSEKRIRCSDTGGKDICKSPDMDAGNQTQVFCKSSKYYSPENDLPRLTRAFLKAILENQL